MTLITHSSQSENILSMLRDLSNHLDQVPDGQRGSIEHELRQFQEKIDDYLNIPSRTLAEPDAAEEREWFHTTLNSIGDAVITADPQGNVNYLNQVAEYLTGWNSAEAVGQPLDQVLSLIDEQTKQPVECPVHKVLECGMVLDLPNRTSLVARDGRMIPIEDSAAPIQDAQGQILGVVFVFHDITERKRSEEALKTSEEKFSKAFNSSPIALALSRPEDGKFIEVNDSYLKLYGFQRDELIGHTSLELGIISPEERAKVIQAFQGGSGFRNFEVKGRAKSGEERDTLFSTEPIEINGTTYMLSVIMDITHLKRVEETLRASELALRQSAASERARANELEALMDAAPAIIWISRDPECREMIGNRFSYDFLRIAQGENVSKTAPEEDLTIQKYHMEKDGRPIPPSDLPIQFAAATGQMVRDYQADIVFENGTIYHLLGNINPLFDQDAKPYGAIGVFTDITPLLQLEAQQIEAQTQIEVQRRIMEIRDNERQGIARDIHDGPIQTLAGTAFNIQFIKEAYRDPTLKVELEQIGANVKNAVRELREIVNDLRPPSLIRFGLTKAIQIHTEDIKEQHPELSINLDLEDNDPQLPEQVSVTLFRIYQEGMNNAIHHSTATHISVHFHTSPEEIFLELRDDGKGFTVPKNISKMANEGHFGLVGMVERAHIIGGELKISSEPGDGTTVIFKGPAIRIPKSFM